MTENPSNTILIYLATIIYEASRAGFIILLHTDEICLFNNVNAIIVYWKKKKALDIMGVFFLHEDSHQILSATHIDILLVISNTSAKSTLTQEDELSWQRFRKVRLNHQSSTKFMSPFNSGKLPVGLEHPRFTINGTARTTLLRKRQILVFVIFQRKKNRTKLDFSEEILKIDVNFRHNLSL
jgi:hypothetical protein